MKALLKLTISPPVLMVRLVLPTAAVVGTVISSSAEVDGWPVHSALKLHDMRCNPF